jgi:UDP-N-acetylglucosamine 2-epimerase
VSTDLKEQLAALHERLERTEAVDAQTLVVVVKDIARLLEQYATADEQRSLPERLEELAVQFEADHPSVSAALRGVIDALAKAGL